MTRRNSRMTLGRRLADLAFVMLLLSGTGRAASAQLLAERIFDRELAVWFGTLSVVGVPVASQDFLRLSDRISAGLESGIRLECGFGRDAIAMNRCPQVGDRSVDARVRNGLGPWINPVQSNVEWTVASSDNFPAHQNLLEAFAAAALALEAYWGSGILTTMPFTSNERSYLMAFFVSYETGPVVAGDTDAPFAVGAPGQSVTVTNNFVANVQYFEQNAVWTLGSQITTPEPGTLSLLGVGLFIAMIAVRRQRQR